MLMKWTLSNNYSTLVCVHAKLLQLFLTLCHPVDCSPPGSPVHGDSPGENTGVGCHALLQGIFPTQGSNPGLLHCRRNLYRLSHQGDQIISDYIFQLHVRHND